MDEYKPGPTQDTSNIQTLIQPSKDVASLDTIPSDQIGPGDALDGSDSNANDEKRYVIGWRLHLLTFGLCLSLLLSTLETTIVSTSLVSISDALHSFEKSGWIVTSYLLTYTGFLVIYARFSDTFGQKTMIMTALVMFTAFSIACGASRNMVELIILRAFQGMGGSGIYSMVTVITPCMVPVEKYGMYMAIVSSVFAVSSLLGPILGGAINDHTSWKWVFYLNAPGGATAIAIIHLIMPSGFPYQNQSSPGKARNILFRLRQPLLPRLRKLDFIGAFLSLSASILLVFALEEAGTEYPWSGAPILTTLILSVLLWALLLLWEHRLSSPKPNRPRAEPLLPWHLLQNRVFAGMLLNATLTGPAFMAAIINLPARFQAVHSTSPSGAGFRLLPLLLVSPLASALTGLLTANFNVPPFYLLATGTALQTLGVGLTSSLPNRTSIPAAIYGYEVLMGFGFGFALSSLLCLSPLVVSQKALAVSMGILTQVRVLGGTVGLAVCTAVLNNHVRHSLSLAPYNLSSSQLDALLSSTDALGGLPVEARDGVRVVFAEGYALQLRVMLAFSGAAMLAVGMIWEKKIRRLSSSTLAQRNEGAHQEAVSARQGQIPDGDQPL